MSLYIFVDAQRLTAWEVGMVIVNVERALECSYDRPSLSYSHWFGEFCKKW